MSLILNTQSTVTTDSAVDFLVEKQPWMSKAQAMALIVDAFERFDEQKKYHGYQTVKTLVDIEIRIFARDEEIAKNRLARIAEWV